MQRTQRLSDSTNLIAQLDLQLSPHSLPPSQQFLIGGGQSIRGYRQNTRSGSNGLRLSLETRTAIARSKSSNPTLTLAPFLDLGTTWNKKNSTSNNFLAGGGLGLIWQPFNGTSLRLDYALPCRRIQDRDNNLHDRSLYFSLNYHL
jgi:hemolysin activation/secretion protein